MTPSYDNSAAVVVMPAVGGGRLADQRLRRWLAQSELERCPFQPLLLANVLSELGWDVPADGLAALRLWGQTGERPTAWIAAADPVSFEPRLDSLRLHDVGAGVTPSELCGLTEHLQTSLGGDGGYRFVQIGDCAYVTAEEPLATAAVPASSVDGERPNPHLPRGVAAAGYRQLVSEIEMALHAHAVNAEREAAGRRPVNSLWLWGGGTAPERLTEPLPPLFGDDALAQGYWLSRTGVALAWPGSIGACLEASGAGFVALVPASDDARLLESLLGELRAALRSGRLEQLVLRFRDGVRAEVRHAHAMRLWRMRNSLLERAPDGA